MYATHPYPSHPVVPGQKLVNIINTHNNRPVSFPLQINLKLIPDPAVCPSTDKLFTLLRKYYITGLLFLLFF